MEILLVLLTLYIYNLHVKSEGSPFKHFDVRNDVMVMVQWKSARGTRKFL